MKPVMVVGLTCFALAYGNSQTIYPVPADSKGNLITLTVANESNTLDARDVQIRLERCPSRLKFTSVGNLVKVVRARKESDAVFRFDVEREVRLSKKDTIEFVISDRAGLLGRKSVIVSYTGPTVYKLDQNFPNPFNPSTTIFYQLPVDSRVTMKLYDVLGREVKVLVDEVQQAGYHVAKLDGSAMASGPYFCRMVAEPTDGMKGYVAVKKILLLK